MLGSLGRLSDHTMLINSSLEIGRAGRFVESWLETELWDTPLQRFRLIAR